MQKSEYYFALPFLFARARGESVERTERNGFEARFVGGAVHLVVYLFAFQHLLLRLPAWEQILLALPLAVLVWLGWLLLLYLDSLVIKIFRAIGLMRTISDGRAQSLLVLSVATLCACDLIATGAWLRFPGYFWLGAVALNSLAALFLSLGKAE